MKKLLCYLGIILLFGLVLFPPILRIVLPEKNEENKSEVVERKILSCSNKEYITSTSYDNQNINMIIIKKLNQNDEVETENNTEEIDESNNTTGKEFIDIFESLKYKSTVVYNVLEDGEVLSIDFTLSDNKELNLTSLTKEIEEQKEFYENQNLSCIIKK